MMEDKEIMRLIGEMDDKHRLELRDLSYKIDKVLDNQAKQSERITINENGIKANTERIANGAKEFINYATVHDNLHTKALKRWYRIVIAMCAVTTAIVGLLAFVLKTKG